MARKRHTAEEIVAKLRQVDVLMAQGRPVADAVRAIGVTEVTYYRWRNEYGGLKGDQVKRLKELETENTRLRRAVSDLTLDKLILAEAAKGNACVDHVTAELGISERRACRVLGQHRSTQRKIPRTPDDEAALTADIIELARQYGRTGIAGLRRCCGAPGGR
jgi:transposase-like protein